MYRRPARASLENAVPDLTNAAKEAAESNKPRRILVVDDDRALHDDYQRLLSPVERSRTDLDEVATALFGESKPVSRGTSFELAHAFQGIEALELVERSLVDNRRFAVAFVDVIMPPGWDGVETTRRIWEVDEDIQVVICTAYSDFSWQETIDRIGRSQGLYLLRKPFDPTQVTRFASTLCQKWQRCHSPVASVGPQRTGTA